MDLIRGANSGAVSFLHRCRTTRNWPGVRVRDGVAFRFTAIAFPSPYATIALYVQDQLRRVGVHMEVQPLDNAIVTERLKSGAFDAAFATIGNGSWLLDKHSSIGYENPEFFALFQRAKDAADPDAQDRAYRELAEIVRTDAPVTFLVPKVDLQIVHRRVKGLSAPWRIDPLMFTEDLWLEEGRQQ